MKDGDKVIIGAILLVVIFVSVIIISGIHNSETKDIKPFTNECQPGFTDTDDEYRYTTTCIPNRMFVSIECDYGYNIEWYREDTLDSISYECLKDHSNPIGWKCRWGEGVNHDATDCIRSTGYWKEKTFEHGGHTQTYQTVLSFDEYQNEMIIDILKNSTGLTREEHEAIINALK